MKANKGFTLVEILIVVVILGILAAIVIPQFTNASIEAKESSLRSELQSLRSIIQLYKMQHNETYPTAGGLAFGTALTTQTNVGGTAWAAGDGTVYGPYIDRLPTNPFNTLDTVREDGAAAGADSHGWRFDTTTGAIQADDDYDSDGDGTGGDHAAL